MKAIVTTLRLTNAQFTTLKKKNILQKIILKCRQLVFDHTFVVLFSAKGTIQRAKVTGAQRVNFRVISTFAQLTSGSIAFEVFTVGKTTPT